jgi:hypothetical protein
MPRIRQMAAAIVTVYVALTAIAHAHLPAKRIRRPRRQRKTWVDRRANHPVSQIPKDHATS